MTTTHRTASRSNTATKQPQLLLVLDGPTAETHWQLDEETREIGRQGLAKARAALQAARPALLDIAA